MKYTRIGRALICFLLVCVLLVNVSPIRAEASVIAIGSFAAAALPVLKAAVIGLGFIGATDAMIYDLQESLRSQGIVDGHNNIEVYHFGDGYCGLAEGILDFIRSWFYDEGIVNENAYFANSFTVTQSYWGAATFSSSVPFNFGYFKWEGPPLNGIALYALFYSTQKATISIKGNKSTSITLYGPADNGYYYYGYSLNDDSPVSEFPYIGNAAEYGSWPVSYNAKVLAEFCVENFALNFPTGTYGDIELGYVAGSAGTFYEGYGEWGDSAIETEDIYYAPIGTITGAGTAAPDYGQEDVWTGTVPIVVPGITVPDGGEIDPEATEPGTGDGTYLPIDPGFSGLITDHFAGVSSMFDIIRTFITELPALIRDFIDVVRTEFAELAAKLKSWLEGILEWLERIFGAIAAIPNAIAVSIADVLADIFVPTHDFLTTKIATIRAEYAFADSIIETGEFIGSALTGLDVEPPVIYIHLDDTEGSYDIGGTVPFIDMTWYSRYKPTVDVLISALLWIVFAWRVFVKLPGIIGGMPGDFVMDALNHIGFADHMPSRKAEYEVQRISLREQIRRGRK